MPPQRSDDFLKDKNPFDVEVGLCVKLFGTAFANWYQDRFLEHRLATMEDPIERLWYAARNYQLYRRLAKAEQLYRQLLNLDATERYRERTTLFLARLLIKQERFEEGTALLEAYLREHPDKPWARYHLGLCYEGVGQTADAIAQYREYQQLRGRKFAIDAVRRLRGLGAVI